MKCFVLAPDSRVCASHSLFLRSHASNYAAAVYMLTCSLPSTCAKRYERRPVQVYRDVPQGWTTYKYGRKKEDRSRGGRLFPEQLKTQGPAATLWRLKIGLKQR